MNNAQQMKWSMLVDDIERLRTKLERKEIQVPQYAEERREIMSKLAKEIRSNPYGEPK